MSNRSYSDFVSATASGPPVRLYAFSDTLIRRVNVGTLTISSGNKTVHQLESKPERNTWMQDSSLSQVLHSHLIDSNSYLFGFEPNSQVLSNSREVSAIR